MSSDYNSILLANIKHPQTLNISVPNSNNQSFSANPLHHMQSLLPSRPAFSQSSLSLNSGEITRSQHIRKLLNDPSTPYNSQTVHNPELELHTLQWNKTYRLLFRDKELPETRNFELGS